MFTDKYDELYLEYEAEAANHRRKKNRGGQKSGSELHEDFLEYEDGMTQRRGGQVWDEVQYNRKRKAGRIRIRRESDED